MKDNDIEDMLDLTFTVNEEVFGQVRLFIFYLKKFIFSKSNNVKGPNAVFLNYVLRK